MRRLLHVAFFCLALPATAGVTTLGRGDANVDAALDALDVFYIVHHLEAAGPLANACFADADSNLDVDLEDPRFLASHLLGNGGGPVSTEVVDDGFDQNCDGGDVCFSDSDNDGYRTDSTIGSSDLDCSDPGEGSSGDPVGDCNDGNPAVNPGTAEIAGDGIDQNCDGYEMCYADSDNDGYRTANVVISADTDCNDPGEAYSAEPAGDCDDNNAQVHPGRAELVADGIDQNCDGNEACYIDSDNDTYRTNLIVHSSDLDCHDPGEAVPSDPSGDCNDSNAAINPGAAEIAGDGIDQNCDGNEACYRDTDNDGYRTTVTFTSADLDCSDPGEALSSEPAGDCCDSDMNVRPSQTSYFSSQSACGTYDYNCDSNISRQYTALSDESPSACSGTFPCVQNPGYGWLNIDAIPMCPYTGSFRDCNQGSCSTVTTTRTQLCR